jgi:rRNA small subunit pseudouridine methyltransferase Nep1
MCLLSVLDSKIGKSSKIFVHTISGKIIEFSSNVRLPRNYNRFIGLMEKLLSDGKIVSNETLIEIRDMNLSELLMRYSDRRFYLLSEDGKTGEPEFDENPLIMIGAFPHGDFNNETKRDIEKFNPQKISIGDESYTSLYVTSRVICSLERRLERVTGKSLQKMER